MKITEWKGYTQSVSLILERLKSHVRFQLRINLLFSFKFPVSTIPEWFSLWRASSWQTPTHFSCASKKSLLDVRLFVKLEFNWNDDFPYRIKIHFFEINFFLSGNIEIKKWQLWLVQQNTIRDRLNEISNRKQNCQTN